MSDLCDATTAFDTPCKNRATGEASGRHYCRISSHRVQVESMAAPAPPALVLVEEVLEPEAPATPPVSVVEEAPYQAPTREQWLAKQLCPTCGAGARSTYKECGVHAVCSGCNKSWQLL